MTTALGECPSYPSGYLNAHIKRYYIQVLMTTGGATSTITSNLPTQPAVANSASSVFAVTNLPPCTGLRRNYEIFSAAATVTEAITTVKDNTAGTMSYRTSKAGVATDPAAGDVITIWFEGDTR